MESRTDKRKRTRVMLNAKAGGGGSRAVRLFDISMTGCRIDCERMSLDEGDRLVLEFSPVIELAGTTVWRKRDMAGVRFDARLPQSIGIHLRA